MDFTSFSHHIPTRRSVLLLVLLGLLGLLALAGPVTADQDLPFEDDFDDGDLDGWTLDTYANGWIKADTVQNVSAPYAMHILSNTYDKARAMPNISYNHSLSVVIEFDFRYTGSHHWISLWRTYETELVLDQYGYLVGWKHYLQARHDIMVLNEDQWYHILIEYDADTQNNTIWVDGVAKETWGYTGGNNRIWVGDFTEVANNGECFWDNFRIRYRDAPFPPVWGPVPVLRAMEDVPITYDFGPNVSDIDSPLDDLTLSTTSTWVQRVQGLKVTFLFPEGVTDARVSLLLSDGQAEVPVEVTFLVQRVNDPPQHDMETEWIATEDVPAFVDFTTHVWDVDNDIADIALVTDDTFAEVEGLVIKVVFPEGVLDHDIPVEITDGQDSVEVVLSFSVTPVDDPPVVSDLGPFVAVEDELSVLSLDDLITDVDTPLSRIIVAVNSGNCSVISHNLRFLYTTGGFRETVTVVVSDATTDVVKFLEVVVEERDDAPVIHPIDTQHFIRDEPRTLDLSIFVEDEETPSRDLTIIPDGHFIIRCEGMCATFQFPESLPDLTVYFNVSDGELTSEGSIPVVVEDAPFTPVVADDTHPVLPILGIIALIIVAFIGTTETSKVWLISLFLPLYMKMHKEDILDQFTRGKIYGYILANPGVHYNAIKRTLEIPNGSFVYHLHLLEDGGFVKAQHDGRYKRYYPSDMRLPKREFQPNESQTQILRIISRSPGISQKEVASIMGVTSAAVNYQVEELINLGFVRKVRHGMSLGYYIKVIR